MRHPLVMMLSVFMLSALPLPHGAIARAQQKAVAEHATTEHDEALIRQMLASGDSAWNRRDATVFPARIAENADHINVAGKWGVGRHVLDSVFTTPRPTMARSIERIRFITPEVAILIVRNQYTRDQRTWDAISTSVLHKINGEWLNEAFQNTLVQPREEAIAQAARATEPLAQTEPAVILPPDSHVDLSRDAETIRKQVVAGVDAWNRRDAKGITANSSEDADHINIAGLYGSGRERLEKGMTEYFARTPPSTMAIAIAKIRFITSDVAIVIARRDYTRPIPGAETGTETLKSITTSVFHKINGTWRGEAFQNTYVRA